MAEQPQNMTRVDESVADIMIVVGLVLCLFTFIVLIGIF